MTSVTAVTSSDDDDGDDDRDRHRLAAGPTGPRLRNIRKGKKRGLVKGREFLLHSGDDNVTHHRHQPSSSSPHVRAVAAVIDDDLVTVMTKKHRPGRNRSGV